MRVVRKNHVHEGIFFWAQQVGRGKKKTVKHEEFVAVQNHSPCRDFNVLGGFHYFYSENCRIFLTKTWWVCLVFDTNIVKNIRYTNNWVSNHFLNIIYHIWDIFKKSCGFSWQYNLSILNKFYLRIIFYFRQIKVSKIDAL